MDHLVYHTIYYPCLLQAQMVRRVKAYLKTMKVITDEDELHKMSLECEPPLGGIPAHPHPPPMVGLVWLNQAFLALTIIFEHQKVLYCVKMYWLILFHLLLQYVQEVLTHFFSNLLYEMGQDFLDTQHS